MTPIVVLALVAAIASLAMSATFASFRMLPSITRQSEKPPATL